MNSYKSQKRTRAALSLIIIIITIYLLSVVSYDAFIATPKKTNKIEFVTEKFGELKIYLDAKLPEIDSALVKHAEQINDQNTQIFELNKLTKVLKEENNK